MTTLNALALALLLAGRGGPPDPTPHRTAILAALRAVEGDSVAAVRSRLARAGTDAPAALGLATLDRLTYDYAAAERRYRALLARGADTAATTWARLGLGAAHASRWQRDSALPHLRRAATEARISGDRHAEIEALFLIARLEARRVGLDSVDVLVRRAETILPLGDRRLVAMVRCLRASWLRPSAPARADSFAAAGLAAARASGIRRVEGACLFVQGTIHEFAGRQPEAIATFRETERVFRAARDLEQLAAVQQWRAFTTIQYSPEFADGRRLATEAIAAGERAGNAAAVAWARLNLAQLALKLGDVSSAGAQARQAEAEMTRLGDESGLAAVQHVRGDAAWLAGRPAEAYAHYERAQHRYRRLGLRSYRARLLLLQAGTLRELGQPGPAAAHEREARSVATESQMGGVLTDATYERALESLARRDWAGALAELDRFEQLTAQGFPHYLYDVRMRRAEAFAGAERFDDAERELASASALLRSWRGALGDRAARLTLLDSRRIDFDADLGLATVIHRLVRAGRTEAALHAAEDRRAQVLWQQMARRATLGGTITSEEAEGDAGLDGLPGALPDSTALLEYLTGRGGEPTTLFVVTRAGIRTATLPSADSLVAPIGRIVALIPSGAPAGALARQLGATLLAPALAALGPGITRLVVVPDGPIHRVPFDAIALPDGRPAVERFRISVAPSARVAMRWWTEGRRPPHPGVLAFADPAYAPSAGLERLAASGDEGRHIAGVTLNVRLLTREAASEAALKRADLRGIGVLHLATHARVQEWGLLESALYLAPGPGEDGRVGPEEIAALALDVDLVMLAGCRTIGGAIVSGEGVQGLAAPFLEAGARAVAATYWEVGDRAMAALMERFYRALAEGRPAGDALWLAKRDAMREGEPPATWAAMTLIGDAGVRPSLARGAATGS